MATKKNSLVGNINRRKRDGKSRPKSRSTISSDAYTKMQEGWPDSKKTDKRAAKKTGKRAAKKTGKRAANKA